MAIDDQTTSPEPAKKQWVRGALKRGFCAAAEVFFASTLAMMLMTPLARRKPDSLDPIARQIAYWDSKKEENDIRPGKPGRFKSAVSFALYTTAYLAPIIGTGLLIQLAAGPLAGLVAAGVINTFTMVGEALLQTARKHGLKLGNRDDLANAIDDKNFSRLARNNALIKGGICAAFTIAAGPLARALGPVTSDLMRGLSRLRLGFLSEQFLRAAQTGIIKSLNSTIGRHFANAVIGNGKGAGASAFGKLVGALSVTRAATDMAYPLVERPDVPEEKPAKDAEITPPGLQ